MTAIDAAYARKWRDLRRRELLALAAFFAYLPGAILLFLVLGIIDAEWTKRYESLIGTSWFGLVVAALLYRGMFRCPNCDKPFFVGNHWRNAFATRCLNCEIRRAEGPPPPLAADLRTRA
jgi:uncharacterized membrane protein YfcA